MKERRDLLERIYFSGMNELFSRRLLQMGVYNSELFNNLGLCCFYAQQYDMTLTLYIMCNLIINS